MVLSDYPDEWPDIDDDLYHRSVKLFSAVRNLLSVNIRLHADEQALQGDIFLFNHFSRFETFIPQFLIFEKTGAYSCAIASAEFFKEDTVLSRYLRQVGVFPHNHPRLFPILANHILRGRKVIIFPEGGMVKDRRVIDKKGEYSIYSRMTGERRKQHTGAAILGQGVEIAKVAIKKAFAEGRGDQLHAWKTALKFENLDELMAAALKPTLIIPSNITFYPIRSSENLLVKSVDLFMGDMSLRQTEELLIESNFLLKDTDMDVSMGEPINPCCDWSGLTYWVADKVARNIKNTDDVFELNKPHGCWWARLLSYLMTRNAICSRNQYMKQIYANTRVNLSHLASVLIMKRVAKQHYVIEKKRFYTVLYIAIKRLQKKENIHLHRSLLNPDDYADLLYGHSRRFEQFICLAKEAELITEQDECYQFLPKLCADYDFDQIRLENPIAVYNNEVAPLRAVRQIIMEADRDYAHIKDQQLAAWSFEDEYMSLACERAQYSIESYDAINIEQTAIVDPSPFFIQPDNANGIGILLIHGLLASPAELRDYGHYLSQQGYTVLGVRIKGHGTSPYALRDISYEEWLNSVQRGLFILKAHCATNVVIGFSTGGALGLKLAHDYPQYIQAVVAVSVPVKFISATFMLVPLLHNTNQIVQWVSSYEGVKPFIENEPEHPQINYRHVPVRALYELRRLMHDLENEASEIVTPSLLLYADKDPVVDPEGGTVLFEKLGAVDKQIRLIKADRHGILMENSGHIWSLIDAFLVQHCDVQALASSQNSPFAEQEFLS